MRVFQAERKRITKTKDSLAERGEFELSVPIREQSDDSIRLSLVPPTEGRPYPHMFHAGACRIALRTKTLRVRLRGAQGTRRAISLGAANVPRARHRGRLRLRDGSGRNGDRTTPGLSGARAASTAAIAQWRRLRRCPAAQQLKRRLSDLVKRRRQPGGLTQPLIRWFETGVVEAIEILKRSEALIGKK
jgi:hypothetical protein